MNKFVTFFILFLILFSFNTNGQTPDKSSKNQISNIENNSKATNSPVPPKPIQKDLIEKTESQPLESQALETKTPSQTMDQKSDSTEAPKLPLNTSGLNLPKPDIKKFKIQNQFLQFKPESNNVKILPPLFTYAIDQGDDFIISSINFNDQRFHVEVGPIKNLTTKTVPLYSPETVVLYFTAPAAIGKKGQIEILTEEGTSIFNEEILTQNIENGELFSKGLNGEISNDPSKSDQINVLIKAPNLKQSVLDASKKSGFRYCWNQHPDKEIYFSRICTPFYRYSKKDQKIKIQTQTSTTKVFLDGMEVEARGEITLDKKNETHFLATTSRGYSIEFKSKVLPLLLTDYFLDESEKYIYLIGDTNIPTFPETKVFPRIDEKSLTHFFLWDPTIGNIKDQWALLLPKDRPQLVLPGIGGGLFLYKIEIPKIPTIKHRLSLKTAISSTYTSNPKLRGFKNKNIELKSNNSDLLKINDKKTEFIWKFPTHSSGEDQESNLILIDRDQEFKAFYHFYKGYSGEFSLRLAGVLSADLQLSLLGEVSYVQWFESILGWQNSLLSQQRWGISARHFSPLKTFVPKGSASTPISLKLSTFDLKYRFTPGLWERDETWGLILGVEDISINSYIGQFGGGGLFWARSMPKIFDTIMSWFPFMNYPKWVDMEMIYYPLSLKSTNKVGQTPTYTINFHGKILWTKYFFGEAGFGIKAYDYKVEKQNIRLQTLYGTMGLGLNF